MTITLPCWILDPSCMSDLEDLAVAGAGGDYEHWRLPHESIGDPISSLAELVEILNAQASSIVERLHFTSDREVAELHHASWLAARALAGLSNKEGEYYE